MVVVPGLSPLPRLEREEARDGHEQREEPDGAAALVRARRAGESEVRGDGQLRGRRGVERLAREF